MENICSMAKLKENPHVFCRKRMNKKLRTLEEIQNEMLSTLRNFCMTSFLQHTKQPPHHHVVNCTHY